MCGCIIAFVKIIVNKKTKNMNSFYRAVFYCSFYRVVFYAIDKPQQLI